MTPLQQAYLAKLKATADANMAFFEKNMPQIYWLLKKEGPSATIDLSDQGDVTIRYADGASRMVAADVVETEKRMERFADLEDRPQILAFHQLRDIEANPGYGDMQRYHYSNLDADFANRAKKHFAKHYPDNTALNRYPCFGEKDIPLVIVFGSGLGWHLERLLLEYRIRHLVVIDTDVDDFRLSTFFQDYVLLSRLALERGTDMSFIVQPEIEQVTRSLMSVLRRKDGLPVFFIHGAAIFYAMAQTEDVEIIKDTTTRTLWEMFFGMGYFDDELISIRHTLDNLQRGFPIYVRPNVVPKDAVAFVVGSGPSLDGLLPLLREYGDRAVIFSCGTALSALANAGIRPDFHVEKERPRLIYEVITKTVPPEFLKGIHFIGLNVIHHDVFNLFESGGMIIKGADVMGTLLEAAGMPPEAVLNTQPTVTNTAVDFVLSAGFKQVYLFGVDMGYKDKERHHSKQTAYLNKMPTEDHLQRLLSKKPSGDIVVPGNFGGEVSTSNILHMAKQMMEYAVTYYPDARVYNLNDGALIDGAVPLHAEEFQCLAPVESKSRALDAIKGAFEQRQFDLPDTGRALLFQIDELIAKVSDIVGDAGWTRSEVIDTIVAIDQCTRADNTPTDMLFRGVISMLMSLTFNAITIIKDEEEAVAKAKYDFGNLLDFFAQARDEVAKYASASQAAGVTE